MNDEKYCTHPTCRAHTAEELRWMGARLGRGDLFKAATESMRATVRCRRLPRKGPIHAPFPTRSAT